MNLFLQCSGRKRFKNTKQVTIRNDYSVKGKKCYIFSPFQYVLKAVPWTMNGSCWFLFVFEDLRTNATTEIQMWNVPVSTGPEVLVPGSNWEFIGFDVCCLTSLKIHKLLNQRLWCVEFYDATCILLYCLKYYTPWKQSEGSKIEVLNIFI